MYVLLLLLGGLTSAVGLALVATGLTAHETPLDPEFMTSGTIAIVGGLILVGLGFVVHALQRIEATLAAQPMPRATHRAEAPAAVAATPLAAVEQAITARPSAPAKPKAEPRPQYAAPAAAPMAEEPVLERLREKFPTLVRFNAASVAEETYVSPAEAEPAEDLGEVRHVGVAARANGAAPARAGVRLDSAARRISVPPPRQKASVFEAFWPNGQRPRRGGQPAPAPGTSAQEAAAALPPRAPARMEPAHEQEPAAPPQAQEPMADARRADDEAAMAGPVSVLKSGVVEGMAYTLYSDGSIEAELPQGRLRFGSINELRNHIESES